VTSLSTFERVCAWDAALSALRAFLRGRGYREVTTPVRVAAPIPEPYIEPVRAEGGVLVTSPEQGLKRLLAAGAGPIFEIAHVFRRAERGRLHAEAFHLAEWYRPGGTPDELAREVVLAVEAVGRAVRDALGRPTGPLDAALAQGVRAVDVLGALAGAVGVALAGDECAEVLVRTCRGKDPDLDAALAAALGPFDRGGGTQGGPEAVARAADLAAWTALFSWWADRCFTPGDPSEGVVRLAPFPAALPALARVVREAGRSVSRRFEVVVAGVEVASGYDEIRDAGALLRRFEAVLALRRVLGAPPIPDVAGVARAVTAIPPAAGVALGLDRVMMLACGAERLDAIALSP